MQQQWINRPAFPAIVGSSFEVHFGRVTYQGVSGDWTAKIRIEGTSRNQWIDIETGVQLDPELAQYAVQAYRNL